MSLKEQEVYEFGPFSLDAIERVLRRDGNVLNLTPKAFDTLLFLVRNQGRVLTKDELLQKIWPNTFVEEVNLAVNISTLRKLMGDSNGGREYIETVPRRGYRFIAEVRKVVPVAEEALRVAEPLISEPAIVPPSSAGAPQIALDQTKVLLPHAPFIERKAVWVALAVLIFLIAVPLAYLGLRRHNHAVSDETNGAAPGANVKTRRSIAVLGFQNLSGQANANWLSTAFSEMLSTELASDGTFRIIPGEDIARLKAELPLTDADSLSKGTLARIHKNLGTDYVVLGSYTVLGGKSSNRIRLDLRLQDSAAGETIASIAETGDESNLFELVSQAGMHLRQPLGNEEFNPANTVLAQSALPASPEAARFYAEGLSKLRIWDNVSARDSLERSIALDPQFPLSHSALSSVWATLGYDAKAADEAKKAFELSAKLSREDRLLVEGRYRETQQEWDNAIGIYRALYELFPDNLDYGLRLANAQNSAGHPTDALATIDTLRKLPSLISKDPRIDLAEARFAANMSDSNRQLAAATRAAQKGIDLGARLIVAEARVAQGTALNDLGRVDEAKSRISEGKDIYESVGDLRGVADSLYQLEIVHENSGDYVIAGQLAERFGKISKQIGDRKGMATSYASLTEVLNDQGDYQGALKLCEQALPLFKEIGEKSRTASVLNNCGNAMSALGDHKGAFANYSQARQIYESLDDKSGVALQLHNIGIVQADQGHLKEAKANFEQALAIWQDMGHKRPSSFALFNIGDALREMGDMEQARSKYQEALKLRTELADKISIAETQLALAEIALAEGQTAEALATAKAVVDVFHTEKEIDDEVIAYLMQARVLLAQKDIAAAGRAVQNASQIAAKTQDIRTRLPMMIVSARVDSVSPSMSPGQAEKIKAQLRNAVNDAHAHELMMFELDAELALADAESQFGEHATAKKHFRDLEQRATANGYGWIARQAKSHAEALGSSSGL